MDYVISAIYTPFTLSTWDYCFNNLQIVIKFLIVDFRTAQRKKIESFNELTAVLQEVFTSTLSNAIPHDSYMIVNRKAEYDTVQHHHYDKLLHYTTLEYRLLIQRHQLSSIRIGNCPNSQITEFVGQSQQNTPRTRIVADSGPVIIPLYKVVIDD